MNSRALTIGTASIAIAGFMAVPVSAVAASHAPTRYAQVGRAPRVPAGARQIGPANGSNQISGAVGLAPRDPAALQRVALAVSNPRSANFHRYLAPGHFAKSYGPTSATIAGVEAALRAAHLTVTSVSGNGLLVRFRGTVTQADAAFRTNIATYHLSNGRTARATTRPVSLPASIASQVVGVTGLNTFVAPTANIVRPTHPASRKATAPAIAHYPNAPKPCAGASGTASDFGGLTDDQIAHAYGVDGLYKAGDTGVGQTVAIYELEPFSLTDLKAFDTCYFGKTAATAMATRVSVNNVDGGAGTGPGSGESILDIEDVSGLAPGANIQVYEAPNTNAAAIDEYNAIIQDDTAQVVSTSWGLCEADAISDDPGAAALENEIFEQGALQGQTVFSSAGDAGSDSCAYFAPVPEAPTLSTSDPSSQPFVTSVGGTTITNAADPPSEQVWNDGSGGGGGGGGISSEWGAPSWQQPFLDTAAAQNAVTNGGAQPCSQSADGGLCRELPDVSAQADQYTGAITVYVAEFGGWNTFGGTSSSTPLWAAMLADVNASSGCTQPVGFVSPALYAVASTPSGYAGSFNDVKTGNNDVYDISDRASYAAHTGYDMASGLGTPRLTSPSGGVGLASRLCALATAAPPPTVTSLLPTTEGTTLVSPLVISGTGFTGAKALSIGGFNVPAADWLVTNSTTITVSVVPTASQAGTGGLGPQDGAGRAIVSVTGSNGSTSVPSATSDLLYVDGTSATPVPSVSGALEYGGPMAGTNSVTVLGSGFQASGGVTGVTVGGVPATGVDVVNDTTLTMIIPPYVLGVTTCLGSDDQTNDVCQAQVVVSNANGPSSTATIEPPYSGAQFSGVSGGVALPACLAGHTCEIVPAASEYDYFVAPSITSITTTSAGDPTTWVSEQGTTIATIAGKGFDIMGFDWVNIGSPTVAANQDATIVNSTATELQVIINPHNPTTEPVTHQLTVQTLGGLSGAKVIKYAGVPRLSAISPSAASDVGGTTIGITGKGFQGVSPADGGELSYLYVEAPISTDQHGGYTANSDTSITAHTPQSNPGEFIVSVCTVTFCSGPTSESTFENSLIDFFQPGDPVVTSVSAKSGPASGGTKLVIHGTNLADAIKVKFGKAVAEAASAPEILTNGSSTTVDAVAPPGKVGSTVKITVTTVESLHGGHPSAPTSAATFHYKASVPAPPRDVTATAHATTLKVHWKTPASNGGHRITRYRVSAIAFPNSGKKGAKKPPTVVVLTKNGKARSATLKRLRGGWVYDVHVQALNSKGRGLPGIAQRDYFIHQAA